MPLNSEVALPGGFVQALAAAESLTDILSAAALWLPKIMGAQRCSVALPQPDDCLAIYALGQELVISESSRLAIGRSLVGQAFTTRRVVNCHDLSNSDGEEVPYLYAAGLRSALVAPFVSGGRSLGTLNIANEEPSRFDAQDELTLRLIADLIASFMSVHQLVESEQALARADSLTNCLNRRAIIEHLHTCFENDSVLPSLLYLDIDGFKTINDTNGHTHGDQVLRLLRQRISGVLDEEDALGRLGGDEFLVVVRYDPTGTRALATAKRIEAVAGMPIVIGSVRTNAPVSIGVASPERDTGTPEELLHDADQAMYTAKGSTSHIVVANEDTRAHAIMVATVDRDLDIGMESGSITYHYQPIRRLDTREIVSAEALIRWNHWELGPVIPPLLIERLEKTGKTDVFTRWSLRKVLTDWSQVRRALDWQTGRTISFNMSPRQLAWEGYADFHMAALEEFGFEPGDMVVEVVESSAVHPGSPPENTLRALCDYGVKIALDDFGTGHNALSYFTRFGIHGIKFDRSLVGAMVENPIAGRILNGLSALATDLGVVSLAEGVETEVEAQLCIDANVVMGQGWHFGRPGPLAGFIELAKAEQRERDGGELLLPAPVR